MQYSACQNVIAASLLHERSQLNAFDRCCRVIDTKVSALDTNGGLYVSELIDVHKGGPARHLHHEQEE